MVCRATSLGSTNGVWSAGDGVAVGGEEEATGCSSGRLISCFRAVFASDRLGSIGSYIRYRWAACVCKATVSRSDLDRNSWRGFWIGFFDLAVCLAEGGSFDIAGGDYRAEDGSGIDE